MAENKVRSDARTMKLAALDFGLVPVEVVIQELQCTRQHLYVMRRDPLYHETLEEIKKEWKDSMLRTPGTPELRKEINYGLSIAVKKLIHILSLKKTPNRDIVAAARLMAQMDGRFIGHDAEEARARGGVDTESVATELIQMIQRARSTDKIQ